MSAMWSIHARDPLCEGRAFRYGYCVEQAPG